MGKLVDGRSSGASNTNPGRSGGTAGDSGDPTSPRAPDVYRARESEVDLLDSSAVRNAHDITIVHSGSGDSNATYRSLSSASSNSAASRSPYRSLSYPSMNSTTGYHNSASVRSARYRQISHDLHALLPSPSLRVILAHESPGAPIVLNTFHTHADQLAGKPETPDSLASPSYPPPDSHPALLARRLLQYTICLQLMAPTVDISRLDLGGRMPCEFLASWVGAVSSLVTSNNELIGCSEGLECLILQGMFQGEAGHLRKAWMTSRRALNMAQLMGNHRRNPFPLRSCAPPGDKTPKPSPSMLWYRISCSERYHSLILGLPVGSRNNSFTGPALDALDSPVDRLGKSYVVIAGRIADRNDLLSDSAASIDAYALTQSIDADLERAAQSMRRKWWDAPDISAALRRPAPDALTECSTMRVQCRHFMLLVLLHLPYLLRDRQERRYEYNRTRCLRASRAILERFVIFRESYAAYVAGRHIDYSALIAAMTLLLGHLGPDGAEQRRADRALVERARAKFRQLASYKNDHLSLESAETISQMLPIVSDDGAGEAGRNVALTVPFLGTVNINSKASGQSPQDLSTSAAEQDSSLNLAQSLGEDFGFDPLLSLSFDINPPPSQDLGFGQGGEDSSSWNSWDGPGWPDFSPELEELVFQGVDTTYWSTLNNSMN